MTLDVGSGDRTRDELVLDDLVQLAGYSESNLPTSPPDRTLVTETDRKIPAWWDTDHWEYPTFVDDILLSSATVSDTTTRTTVWSPGINADSLKEGRVYQLDLMGFFSTVNNSAEFDTHITLGGTTDLAGIGSAGGNVDGAPWSIEMTMTVRSTGQNGVLKPHTRGLFDSVPEDNHHTTVTVDTTTPVDFDVDVQWTEADPGNTCTLAQAHLKQMG